MVELLTYHARCTGSFDLAQVVASARRLFLFLVPSLFRFSLLTPAELVWQNA